MIIKNREELQKLVGPVTLNGRAVEIDDVHPPVTLLDSGMLTQSPLQMVQAFYEYAQDGQVNPMVRYAYFAEEVNEMSQCFRDGASISEIVKEVCDVMYTLNGIADAIGKLDGVAHVDWEGAYDAVAANNLLKVTAGGFQRDTRSKKILKSPTHPKVDLSPFIEVEAPNG